jgi:ferredoxin-type protein NapH
MADLVQVAAPRSAGRSALLTLPVLLWALLMFSRTMEQPGRAPKAAALITLLFLVGLFYQMMRTRQTHRWRRYFFVALGFLFPVGFIWQLLALRGSMNIPVEGMLAGNTPFCFMVIPMVIAPAALTKAIIFPGSILPTAANPHAIASMVALWLGATLVLGKGWCSYGCFFGGIEEGFSSMASKPRIKKVDPRWRWMPWAVLAAIVLLSAATFSPVYCEWLCPFKTVTEYAKVTSLETAMQTGIFLSLFFGLVVALPVLTKKRTQCSFFCPFGAFQSVFNKTGVFEVRIDREKCQPCNLCEKACPTYSIGPDSIESGKTRLSCMKCGACVDACRRGAAVWHVKGTPVGASPERARLLHLYSAWAFAVMFGGSIIAGTLATLLGNVI